MQLEELKKDFPKLDFSWQLDLVKITEKLREWFFVGGCVRDSLLNIKKPTDIDITTKMCPDEIESVFKDYKMILIGKRFGTIGVFYKGYQIEITTTRMDIVHYGRKADVSFGVSFLEDSCRRDFTINALLFNKEIIDYHGGIEDLKSNRVRFIGSATIRIKEDYLRILRYLRFFLRFESSNEISYIEEIRSQLDGLSHVSIERIINEIEKMFYINSQKAIKYLNYLQIPQKLFQEKFFTPLYFSENYLKTLAYSIYFWKKPQHFPINKVTKSILDLQRKYSDNFLNYAFLWYRKGEKGLKNYIDLQKALGEYYEIRNIEYFHKPDLSNFCGIERGEAEVAVRYLFLKYQEFNDSNIKEILRYIKNVNNT